jgi:hypothetical protein
VTKVNQRDANRPIVGAVRITKTLLLTTTAAALALTAAPGPQPAQARSDAPRHVALTRWDTAEHFAKGTGRGWTVVDGELRMGEPFVAGAWERATWVSPWRTHKFALTEAVPSWVARTPGKSRVHVWVRGRTAGGTLTSWDRLAIWAQGDKHHARRSGDSQPDDGGRVSYDTWLSNSGTGFTSWQLRVWLDRPRGGAARVGVDTVGAVVSRLPNVSAVTTSRPRPAPNAALGRTLNVPRLSQMVHRDHYTKYAGGGASWCSPTSVAMVLRHLGKQPRRKALSWIPTTHTGRDVDHAARMTYDAHLRGTGNWSFNTAYAARYADAAWVTRLRDLRGAERWIGRGVPVVASLRFGRGELTGAPLSSTPGHLVVIVGFTRSGDVVVNDPAASSASGVRRIYDRGQFEDAWLKRYSSGGSMLGSGGLAYIIR